jgi:hypothetical protein
MNTRALILAIIVIVLAAIAYFFLMQKTAVSQDAAVTAAPTASSTDQRLAGTWKSTDDAKYTREFSADGSVVDRYEGDDSATETGTYVQIDPSTDAGLPVPAAALAGQSVIRIDFPKEGAMYFSINTLTDTSLAMTYLSGRGNVLSFTRVQ